MHFTFALCVFLFSVISQHKRPLMRVKLIILCIQYLPLLVSVNSGKTIISHLLVALRKFSVQHAAGAIQNQNLDVNPS